MLSILDGDKIRILNEAVAPSGLNYIQKCFDASLKTACENGATEIVHLILSGGLDPGLDGEFDSLPLYLAARGGFTAFFSSMHGAKKTLELVVSPNSNLLSLLFIKDDQGNCPLEIAIISGHESFAVQAFEAMAKHRQWYSWEPELDTERSHGQSVLHLACTHDLPELAKVLVTHGFRPHVVDKTNYSAFQIAAASGSCKAGKILLEHDKNQTISQDIDASPMLLAVSNDRVNYVKLLLENGADIECQDPTTGYTPLLAAAIEVKVDTVKLLLERGANILAKDLRGRALVQLVMISGALQALYYIFDNVNVKNAKELLDQKLVINAIASDRPLSNLI
ncbi:B-cell CLL lymphoma 3 [Arthrobotrys conoides]|uniref:B-cell CLL lymphoma 3 n=1 Tax=Arthrobotrys conoides TaxID=74498 RepID=A0AAN8RKR3_9PEZI